MALKPFFSLIFTLFLFSCSFEQEEQINYEAEFNSIVSEFEKSSILNFDRKDIEKDTFLEQFITKLDKQKNTFLKEDLNKFIENDDKVLHLSLMTKALKTMPGSPKQKEIIKQLNKVRKRLKLEPLKEAPRIPRKKGQPAGSDKHSDLYTDENPKGTIHGLGFKDEKTARESVKKINNSNRKHAHKIQAAIAMEQRAKVAGKTKEAAIYRSYIEKMKKKTKEMNK